MFHDLLRDASQQDAQGGTLAAGAYDQKAGPVLAGKPCESLGRVARKQFRAHVQPRVE
jgi:hypothetical protein